MIRSLIWLGALLGGLCFQATAAPLSPREIIEGYTAQATQLELRDARREVVSEMGTLRAWLGEAQVYLKQEDDKQLAFTIRRVQAQAGLIQALLDRKDAERAAKEAAEAVIQREQEASAMAEEAFRFEKELVELERKTQEETP
ncbi:hypothetical protein KKF91_15960 [Myxococcota bacterium]|nr:hypothetical protein [Myxococcota bacterium]MBU1432037.1 hypothetical protein [Myxococcota bacterium]MBU1899021.1 hypothetical protein [Myxococcota bacterium]